MSSIKPDGDGSEVNGGEEVACGFVVACGDGAKLFELAEKVFDQVPCFVNVLVIETFLFAPLSRRNNDLFSGFAQRLKNTIFSVVAFIRQNSFCRKRRQKLIGAVQIARLSLRQTKTCRVTQSINSCIDFRA